MNSGKRRAASVASGTFAHLSSESSPVACWPARPDRIISACLAQPAGAGREQRVAAWRVCRIWRPISASRLPSGRAPPARRSGTAGGRADTRGRRPSRRARARPSGGEEETGKQNEIQFRFAAWPRAAGQPTRAGSRATRDRPPFALVDCTRWRVASQLCRNWRAASGARCWRRRSLGRQRLARRTGGGPGG